MTGISTSTWFMVYFLGPHKLCVCERMNRMYLAHKWLFEGFITRWRCCFL